MSFFDRVKKAAQDLLGALGGGRKEERKPPPPPPPAPKPPPPPPPPPAPKPEYRAPGYERRYAPEEPEEEEDRPLSYFDRFTGKDVRVKREDESEYEKSELRTGFQTLPEAVYYLRRIPVPTHIFINSEGLFQIAVDYTKVTYKRRKDTRKKRHRKDVRKSYKYR